MKRTSFLLLALLLQMSSVVHADIPRGQYLLGGNTSIESRTFFADNLVGENAQYLLINPLYGKFIRKNLAVGPSVIWEYEYQDGFQHPRSTFQGGLFARLYTSINLFVEGSVKYRRFSNEFQSIDHSLFTGVAMGYSARLRDGLALEPRGYLDFGLGQPVVVYSGLTIGIVGLLEGAGDQGEDRE